MARGGGRGREKGGVTSRREGCGERAASTTRRRASREQWRRQGRRRSKEAGQNRNRGPGSAVKTRRNHQRRLDAARVVTTRPGCKPEEGGRHRQCRVEASAKKTDTLGRLPPQSHADGGRDRSLPVWPGPALDAPTCATGTVSFSQRFQFAQTVVAAVFGVPYPALSALSSIVDRGPPSDWTRHALRLLGGGCRRCRRRCRAGTRRLPSM